jgi:hypothetical protein
LCGAEPAGAALWIVAVASGKYYAKAQVTASGSYTVTLAANTRPGSARTFYLVKAATASDAAWLAQDHQQDSNPSFNRTTPHGTEISNGAPNTFTG